MPRPWSHFAPFFVTVTTEQINTTVILIIYNNNHIYMQHIVKRKLYEAGKQYHSKNELKEAIKECCKTISPETIKNLKILERPGGYINM